MSVAPPDLRTHRPPWAPVIAVVWMVVAVALSVDLVRRGDASEVVTGVLVLASASIVAYCFGLQPCVIELPDGVLVINPLRRVRLGWGDIVDVIPRDVLVLVTDHGEIRCAGVVGRGRTAEAGRQATRLMFPSARGDDLRDLPAERRSDPKSVTDRLVPRWEASTAGGAEPTGQDRLRPYPPSVLLLAAAAVMVVVALLV